MLTKLKSLTINQKNIKIEVNEPITIDELFEMFYISKSRRKYFKINPKEDLLPNIPYTISCDIEPKEPLFSKKPIDIVYEDDICIIVNKPSNLLIHDDGNTKDTLCSRVNFYDLCENHPFFALPIHRIDKDTSGLVFFCKHPFFQSYFDKQIEEHIIQKEYLAIVKDKVAFKKKQINKPISKNRHDAKKMIIHPNGKPAISYVTNLAFNQNYTLLHIKIKTGRKHQIRVHLSSIGYPIVNDELYGKVQDNRKLLLQSYRLTYFDPLSKKSIEVVSPMDARFSPFSNIDLVHTTYRQAHKKRQK